MSITARIHLGSPIPGIITCLCDFLKSFGRAAESNEFQGWCAGGDELRQA